MRPRVMLVTGIALGCAAASATGASASVTDAETAGTPYPVHATATSLSEVATPVGADVAPAAHAVNALVVQSWSGCTSDDVVWQTINTTWVYLGDTKVKIDYDSAPVCDGSFTYADLAASGADVLILSDPAGGLYDLDKTEKKAIQRYVEEGHGLYASFLTFRNRHTDNRSLEPLLGIDTKISGSYKVTERYFTLLEPDSPLFTGVPNPYDSAEKSAQVPRDLTWDDADLADTARYVAKIPDDRGVIIVNDASTHRAVYASSMPEASHYHDDVQFIYNAMVYLAGRSDETLNNDPR